jgi:hypothetical protein
MRWDIHPWNGIGPLKFGMTPIDVAAFDNTIGQTIRTDVNNSFRSEYRPSYTPYCEYENDHLNLVDTANSEKISVFFEEIDIFHEDSRNVMRYLEKKNGGIKGSNVGGTLFENIGIVARNFFDIKNRTYFKKGTQDDRSMAIFAQGAWDRFIKTYRNISLP